MKRLSCRKRAQPALINQPVIEKGALQLPSQRVGLTWLSRQIVRWSAVRMKED